MRQLSCIFTAKHVVLRVYGVGERGTGRSALVHVIFLLYQVCAWQLALWALARECQTEAQGYPQSGVGAASGYSPCTNRDAPPPDDADGGVGRERVQAVHTHATVTLQSPTLQ